MQYEMQKAKIEEARRMEQMQAEADKKIAQAQIKRLNAEIDGKREALHRALVERIAWAQQVYGWALLSVLPLRQRFSMRVSIKSTEK